MSDWSTHYQSWKNNNFCPIKIIKYEDCLIDAQKVFVSTLNFLSKFLKFEYDKKNIHTDSWALENAFISIVPIKTNCTAELQFNVLKYLEYDF